MLMSVTPGQVYWVDAIVCQNFVFLLFLCVMSTACLDPDSS